MPRLGHKKSRTGCRQCKARHVKCDELKPCSNCARHGVQCSLTSDPSASQQGSASTAGIARDPPRRKKRQSAEPNTPNASAPSPSLQIDYVLNPPATSQSQTISTSAISQCSSPSSSPDNFPFLTRFIHGSDESCPDVWVRDLELMHHWTVEAYDQLSQREDMRHTWRVEAPIQAVNHVFLLHELLAFSALHKAYKLPERRSQYYTCGIHHQDLAIRGVREKLQNPTTHEEVALVATSTLLTLSVFASTGFELCFPDNPSSQGAIDGILNIFSLMQGMRNVTAMAQSHVHGSWLSPMFQDSADVIAPQPILHELINHIPSLASFVQSKPDLPSVERNVYLQVIGHLEPALQLAMSPKADNRELRFLVCWPFYIQSDFLNLVRQRYSGALAILMYYSTMLFAAQSRYWFMQGWGEHLMKACSEATAPDWLPCMQWPLSFIGHKHPYTLLPNPEAQRQTIGVTPANLMLPPFQDTPRVNAFKHPQPSEVTTPPADPRAKGAQHGEQPGSAA
ncbi:hypothetical protein EK21DRAFT_99881 [Setomelanomma holmii]|uniref:Zn(2)-C6 fungal-type domain-containing protein n=1 Tax=Setomelanomma holmii TaxID=210430 RepID=A0A9P4HCD0_9PLEO|nr:hypothetical protein EK21DRAFT_99881 [Setomelanomma holmii]